MMNKVRKIFEYAYILIFVLSVVELFRLLLDDDASNDGKAVMFAGFAILAVAMFFIRRKQRKTLENRNVTKDQ